VLSHTATPRSGEAWLESSAARLPRIWAIGVPEPCAIVFSHTFDSCFHTPLTRVFTHRTIVFSHTESRVFTHRRFWQAVDFLTETRPFFRLNLLNDSYLTESFNVERPASRQGTEGTNGIGLPADALSLGAAYGVTEAAQAPLARRERSKAGGRRNHSLRPPRRAVRAGEGIRVVREA